MFDKMKQLYEMQKQARELQKQLETIRVDKTSKDTLLRVELNGALRLESLSIDSSYLIPDKKTALERALVALINDAFADVQKQSAAHAAGLMKGLPGF
jgi:DNA-binding YbaB/EbfC family protein